MISDATNWSSIGASKWRRCESPSSRPAPNSAEIKWRCQFWINKWWDTISPLARARRQVHARNGYKAYLKDTRNWRNSLPQKIQVAKDNAAGIIDPRGCNARHGQWYRDTAKGNNKQRFWHLHNWRSRSFLQFMRSVGVWYPGITMELSFCNDTVLFDPERIFLKQGGFWEDNDEAAGSFLMMFSTPKRRTLTCFNICVIEY